MASSTIRKPFLKLLPIQIAAVTAGSINALVDTILTGRYIGPEAVAGIGFFNPMLTVTFLFYVILRGTTILCGRAIGSGRRNDVISLFSTAVATVTGYGLLLGFGCFCLRSPLAGLLGARGETAEYLRSYIAGYAPGIPFLCATSALLTYLPCNNELKKSYYVTGFMVASNTALDFLMVSVLKTGTFGMGLATAVSYALSTLILFPAFLKKSKAYHFEWKLISFRNMRETIRLGFPEVLFNAGVTLRSYLLNLTVMGSIGAAGIAALNVENTLLCFIGAIPQGTGNAFTLMASIYYGERDRESLKALTGYAVKTGLLLSGVVMAIAMAGSGVISGFFFPEGGETARLTREMLLCFSSSFVFNTVFVVWTRLLQIEEHMKIVNVMNFMGQLFIAGMAIAGMQLFGATGVWLAQPLADILSLLSVLVWIMAGLRRLPRCAEEWMKLPEGFGAKAEDVLEATVNSMEEVARLSKDIIDFLGTRGFSMRTRSVVGLCVEEMAGNVICYGRKDGKAHTVEIRVVAEKELVVRVRDDCPAFDPKQRIDQFEPEDPAKNIGIRMIGRLTKHMDYHTDAGVNTLLMII